mmetsp:Transcript_47167/g.115216  ORF Transcript_47167/g.115216 Transcript_47167/m.115216 type:complete len:616 (+) Transcript_47167:115-1962(+)
MISALSSSSSHTSASFSSTTTGNGYDDDHDDDDDDPDSDDQHDHDIDICDQNYNKFVSMKELTYICRLLLIPSKKTNNQNQEQQQQQHQYDDDNDHDSKSNNSGLLNFRNLVWHGFVPNVPRPWFALVVFLIVELQQQLPIQKHDDEKKYDNTDGKHQLEDNDIDDNSEEEIFDLRTNSIYKSLLEESSRSNSVVASAGNATVDFTTSIGNPQTLFEDAPARLSRIRSWIYRTTNSKDYADLWDLVESFVSCHERPATICALLSVIVEHTLRIEWCAANSRPADRQARHGSYYVTLDGYGQRTVHDLLLNPYISSLSSSDGNDDSQRNKYLMSFRDDNSTDILRLDEACLAILTDLFCSPMGPNIRSAVSHGLWDTYLRLEWTQSTDRYLYSKANEGRLWDMVRAILISLDRIVSSRTAPQCNEELRSLLSADFRPQFTYVEDNRRQLQRLHSSVGSMTSLRNSSSFLLHITSAKAALPNIAGENEIFLGLLNSNSDRLYETILLESCMDSCIGTYDVFGEFDYNRQLESLGASRMLLRELATTIESQVVRLEFALAFLGNDESDNRNETSSILSATAIKRKTKTSLRVVRTSETVQLFYLFCLRVVIESLPRVQ